MLNLLLRRKRRLLLDCQIFLLLFCFFLIPATVECQTTTATPTSSSSDSSSVADDEISQQLGIIDLDCDPCIARTEYHLRAVLHGSSEDENWIQLHNSIKQAAADLRVNLQLHDLTHEGLSGEQMAEIILREAQEADAKTALLVSIPDETVEFAIQEVSSQIPVFSLNMPHAEQEQLGLRGVVQQDNIQMGQQAAQAFIDFYDNNSNDTGSNLNSALFIQSSLQPPSIRSAQSLGFRNTMFENNPDVIIENITIDPTNVMSHALAIERSILDNNCNQYQAILLGDAASVHLVVDALKDNCASQLEQPQVGVVNVGSDIYTHLTRQELLFALDPQLYLQAALTTIIATLFITTGKELPREQVMPLRTSSKLITQSTVPPDGYQTCQAETFPVCQSDGGTSSSMYNCRFCERNEIRIGAVVHGLATDSWWDHIITSSRQAAIDMGIELDLEQMHTSNPTRIYDQMAAQIRNKCESGVDALFISIPTEEENFLESIRQCQQLNVPIIAINAGVRVAQNMGLTYFIGMDDYVAGYQAGVRLIESGRIRRAYCLNHIPGGHLEDRCRGLEDAINDQDNTAPVVVEYAGQIAVPRDNDAQLKVNVENGVAADDGEIGSDWEGLGFLSLSPENIPPLRQIIVDHPMAIVGTFDVNEDVYESLVEDWLIFGMDQQPTMQGSFPVYLLTYLVQTNQTLHDQYLQTGPIFITRPPSHEETICTENKHAVCPYHEENMNLIPSSVLTLRYIYFGINVVMCVIAAGWTFWNRYEWIVKISQPEILACVIFGCFVSNLSLLFEGVQTGYREIRDPATGQPTDIENPDIEWVDAACMASPWLFTMGFAFAFSMLYAKVHRVKIIYSRVSTSKHTRHIGFKDVAHIVAIVLSLFLVLLTLWQIIAPYQWHREVTDTVDDIVNGYPTESYGICTSETGDQIFEDLIYAFQLIVLAFLLVLCWRTKDFDDDFAESSYISLAILLQFQLTILVLPITSIIEYDPTTVFFIYVTYYFLINFGVLALLFIPKMVKLHNIEHHSTDGGAKKKKITVPLSSLTNSKWDEGVDVINRLLDEDNDTYQAMTEEERNQLAGVKVLLLNGAKGTNTKEDRLQYIPSSLLGQSAVDTMTSSTTVRPRHGMRVDSGVAFLMREFGGINVGTGTGTGTGTVADSSALSSTRPGFTQIHGIEEEESEDDCEDDQWSHEITTSQKRNIARDFSLASSTMGSELAEEVEGDLFFIPTEFQKLSIEDKKRLFELLSWSSINSWDYDIFELAEVSRGHPLLFMGYAVLGSPYSVYSMGKDCGALDSDVPIDDLNGYHFIDDHDLRIPMERLCNYLRAIEEDYNSENPYHNEIHAADVVQTLHSLLQMKSDVLPSTKIDLFTILLAAVVHDVNHPGENNAFQANCESDLALTYNDISILENRHASHAFVKMVKEEGRTSQKNERNNIKKKILENNILCNAKTQTIRYIRKKVIDAVLHTDMSKHFKTVGELKAKVLSGEINNDDNRWDVLQYVLHLADISNPAKPKKYALLWTDRCLDEFFAQGDKEKKLGLPVSPNCDRRTTKKPDSQIGFISFVIKPAYELLGQIIPSVQEQIVVQHIDTNLQYWQKEKDNEGKKKQ